MKVFKSYSKKLNLRDECFELNIILLLNMYLYIAYIYK